RGRRRALEEPPAGPGGLTSMMYSDTDAAREIGKSRVRLPRVSLGEFGSIWLALAGLALASPLLAPETARSRALVAMAPFARFLAVVAVGQMLVIRQRGLDMSAGSMMTLSGLVLAELAARTGMTTGAVVATLAFAALAGVVNGLLVARINISPI